MRSKALEGKSDALTVELTLGFEEGGLAPACALSALFGHTKRPITNELIPTMSPFSGGRLSSRPGRFYPSISK